jgi:hypothetical protein
MAATKEAQLHYAANNTTHIACAWAVVCGIQAIEQRRGYTCDKKTGLLNAHSQLLLLSDW